jgi:NAD(P)-dependent dehydrogenase (short-subunit alcohol dehydrogenase family)
MLMAIDEKLTRIDGPAGGRLRGRRILLAGGAAGIGLETARAALQEGAAVALIDRRPDALASAKEALQPAGEAICLTADVTDADAVERAVSAAAEALDGIDGLVNCAAIDFIKPLVETSLSEWQALMTVNLTGPMLVCRAAIPAMTAAGGGAIVNIASGAALMPLEGRTAYCASKAGLVMFGKALAIELAVHRIRVNSVCPGAVDTELYRSVLKGGGKEGPEAAAIRARYLLKRLGTTVEVAAAILFLLSEEASFVTGTTLAVDGGRSFH